MVDRGLFLVELHARLDSRHDRRLLASVLQSAIERSDALSRPGRVVWAVAVPERSALFCVIEASDEARLRDLLAAASVHVARVEPAVRLADP
jgi:hypothetical protein